LAVISRAAEAAEELELEEKESRNDELKNNCEVLKYSE